MQLVQVDPETGEHLDCLVLSLSSQPQEQVLGVDAFVAEPCHLAQGELEDLLRSGAERWRSRGLGLHLAGHLVDLLAGHLARDAKRHQRLGRDSVALLEQCKEEVLSSYEWLVEETGFIPGQDEHPPSSIGEALEHDCELASLSSTALFA